MLPGMTIDRVSYVLNDRGIICSPLTDASKRKSSLYEISLRHRKVRDLVSVRRIVRSRSQLSFDSTCARYRAQLVEALQFYISTSRGLTSRSPCFPINAIHAVTS